MVLISDLNLLSSATPLLLGSDILGTKIGFAVPNDSSLVWWARGLQIPINEIIDHSKTSEVASRIIAFNSSRALADSQNPGSEAWKGFSETENPESSGLFLATFKSSLRGGADAQLSREEGS